MNKQNYGRSELLMVMAVQRQTARVTALIRTLFLAAVSALALSLVLIGLDTWPLFQVSNDFEYTWGATGSMLIGGLTLDGVTLTTFNPAALAAYLGVAAALTVWRSSPR